MWKPILVSLIPKMIFYGKQRSIQLVLPLQPLINSVLPVYCFGSSH